MDNNTIFTKTAKGVGEAVGKTRVLSRELRLVLKEVDGITTLDEMLGKLSNLSEKKLYAALTKLRSEDYIREFAAPALDADTLDFTTILPNIQKTEREPGQRTRINEALRLQLEARARAEVEAYERMEREQEERERRGEEAQARRQQEKEAARAAQMQAMQQAQEAARLEAEERARQKIEEQAKQEVELARRAAEEAAKREAELKARLELEQQKRQEAEQQARQVAEEKARLEAEAKARQEAEEKNRRDAEQRAKKDEEDRIRREAEEQARRGAEQAALREAAEQASREAAEAEEKRLAEEHRRKLAAEHRAKRDAEVRAKRALEEQARREAEEQARQETEEKARSEALELVRREAEENARREAEELARQEAEEKTRSEALALARRESDEKTRRETEERARLEAEEQARREQALEDESGAEEIRREFEALTREQAELEARSKAEQARRQIEEIAQRKAAAKAKKSEEERLRREADREEARREEDARAKQEVEQWKREAAMAKAGQPAAEEIASQPKRRIEPVVEGLDLQNDAADYDDEDREIEEDDQWDPDQPEVEKKPWFGRREKSIRAPIKWRKPAALVLSLSAVAGVALIHVVPFDERAAMFEKAATAQLQQPVAIGKLYLSLLPQPQWRLEDVSIGSEAQVTIAQINAIPELSSLYGDQAVFKSIELQSPVLNEQALEWLLFGKAQQGHLSVARVTAHNATLASKNITLPSFNAVTSIGANGSWAKISIDSLDRKTRLQLLPDRNTVKVELNAESFAMPFGSNLKIDEFAAKGTAHRNELAITDFSGRAYDGIITGAGKLQWGTNWSMAGSLQAKLIDATRLVPKLLQTGRLAGSATFAVEAEHGDKLFALPRMEGSFVIQNGTVLGVDFAKILRSANSAGTSSFTELNGTFIQENGKAQLQNIYLNAGLLSVTGNADMDKNENLNGRLSVELRSPTQQARSMMAVAGTLTAPQFSR